MRNELLLLNDTLKQRPITKKLCMLCSLGFNNLDLNNGWGNANSGLLVDPDGMGPDPVIILPISVKLDRFSKPLALTLTQVRQEDAFNSTTEK